MDAGEPLMPIDIDSMGPQPEFADEDLRVTPVPASDIEDLPPPFKCEAEFPEEIGLILVIWIAVFESDHGENVSPLIRDETGCPQGRFQSVPFPPSVLRMVRSNMEDQS